MLNWLKRKTVVVRPEELQKVNDILFPALETVEMPNGVYQIDYSVDSNLESALSDLKDGINDESVHTTIQKAIDALIRARAVLHSYPILDERSSYLIIDHPYEQKKEIEAE